MTRSVRDTERRYFRKGGKFYVHTYGFRGNETCPIWVDETEEVSIEVYWKGKGGKPIVESV